MTYSSLNQAAAGAERPENLYPKATRALSLSTVLKFLLATGFALALFGLDINSPFETDQEPYYASVIRDVAENGRWLAPLDGYGEICRKPPLYLWLSALLVKATRGSVDEVTTRAVSLTAGAVLAGETLLVGQACLGPAGGWLAYLFLLGSYGFASQAACAQTDMLMALFVLSAIVLACRLEEGKAPARAGGAIGLLLGLAILTKGPLALVLSGLVMMVYRGLAGQNPLDLFRRGWVWRAAALACVIGLSWYAIAWLSWRENLLTVHVLQENLGHFLPARFGGTGEASKPLYFPTLKLLGGALPMSLGAPALVLAIWRSGRGLVSRKLLALQLSIVIVVLVFFTLASSKRPVYVLPAYPALAILLAWVFLTDGRLAAAPSGCRERSLGSAESIAQGQPERAAAAQEPRARTAGRSPDRASSLVGALRSSACMLAVFGFAAAVVACLIAKFALDLLPGLAAHFAPTDAGYTALFVRLATRPALGVIIFVSTSAIGQALVIGGLWRKSRSVSSFGVALLALAGVGLWLGLLKPAHAQLYTLKGFVATARSSTGQAPVYVLGGEDYQVSFYYKKTVPIWRPDELAKSGARSSAYLIGWSNDLARAQIPAGHRLELSFCAGAKRPRGQMCLAKVSPLGSTASGFSSR
jgi:hypothetical protein